jgi:hypothetical protein
MPDDRLIQQKPLLIERRVCFKIPRAILNGIIGYGGKNPAAERMVGDDLPQNREK